MSPCQSFETAANAAITPFKVRVKAPAYITDRVGFRVVTPEGRSISKTYWVTPTQIAFQLDRLVMIQRQRMRATGYSV